MPTPALAGAVGSGWAATRLVGGVAASAIAPSPERAKGSAGAIAGSSDIVSPTTVVSPAARLGSEQLKIKKTDSSPVESRSGMYEDSGALNMVIHVSEIK
jgi:hypothetical protein